MLTDLELSLEIQQEYIKFAEDKLDTNLDDEKYKTELTLSRRTWNDSLKVIRGSTTNKAFPGGILVEIQKINDKKEVPIYYAVASSNRQLQMLRSVLKSYAGLTLSNFVGDVMITKEGTGSFKVPTYKWIQEKELYGCRKMYSEDKLGELMDALFALVKSFEASQ